MLKDTKSKPGTLDCRLTHSMEGLRAALQLLHQHVDSKQGQQGGNFIYGGSGSDSSSAGDSSGRPLGLVLGLGGGRGSRGSQSSSGSSSKTSTGTNHSGEGTSSEDRVSDSGSITNPVPKSVHLLPGCILVFAELAALQADCSAMLAAYQVGDLCIWSYAACMEAADGRSLQPTDAVTQHYKVARTAYTESVLHCLLPLQQYLRAQAPTSSKVEATAYLGQALFFDLAGQFEHFCEYETYSYVHCTQQCYTVIGADLACMCSCVYHADMCGSEHVVGMSASITTCWR